MFNKIIVSDIFKNMLELKRIIFGEMFNSKICGKLPENLLYLEFGSDFVGRLKEKTIPVSLINLKISRRYPYIRYLKKIIKKSTMIEYY